MIFFLFLLIMFGNSSASAAELKFTSAYTDLSTDCKPPAPSENKSMLCKGVDGYNIWVTTTGDQLAFRVIKSTHYQASDSSTYLASQNHDATKRKVEWRLANGHPFAVIMRIKNGRTGEEKLTLKGIGPQDCIATSVPNGPEANEQARREADRRFNECISTEGD